MSKNITLRVSGISCEHCVAVIKKAVEKLVGVEKVNIDLSNGTVSVDGNNCDIEAIKEAINMQGYEVL